MTIKLIGALMIVLSCGGVGFAVASSYKTEIAYLKQIISVTKLFVCELEYHLTPLPELMHMAVTITKGKLRNLFQNLACELDKHSESCVQLCVQRSLDLFSLPLTVKRIIQNLSLSLGKYDLTGQICGIQSAKKEAEASLELLLSNHEIRLRSYQTLGLCAGAAIAIIFI